nr:pyridoxal-phosphate dependent enzyme [Flavihumibacter rivuli]
MEPITIPLKGDTRINILRLDRFHPVVSGNKWFKLRYYLEEALQSGKKGLVTFGGAYSNHIVAAAFAAKENGLLSYGIIRGEEPRTLSPTLLEAEGYGMKFLFVSREQYQLKTQQPLFAEFPAADWTLIPEGGYGEAGIQGAATILDAVSNLEQFSHIAAAVGTGTMLAGLARRSLPLQQLVGISALKGEDHLTEEVMVHGRINSDRLRIFFDYHFGGYAKHPSSLLDFMNGFYQQTSVPTDIVYTSKLCYGILDLAGKGYFPKGSNILLIHSGGLQGNRSLLKGELIF